ncbi:MAG: transcriptional regulator [Anaerolineales bacterium]
MTDDIVLNKSQRLARLNHLLYRHPSGLTTRELARLCHVDQRTIQRDLHDLEDLGIPLWEDDGTPRRYGIDKGYYIPPIHLSLQEAVSLYLAGRLLARYCDHCDIHTSTALAKLANVLPEPMSAHMHATIAQMATRQDDREHEEVMETLATAWATRRVVHVHYRSAHSDEIREYDLRPYCLEASGEGGAIYVIGWAEPSAALRTFKVERVVRATLTKETFEAPEELDVVRLLDTCWGIMYGEQREEVVLRFAASATRRIQETVWHPSQTLQELPDGGCELHLQLAHPEEMVYWIRGWGPQVEVVAPLRLREQMAAEARETACIYGDGRRE